VLAGASRDRELFVCVFGSNGEGNSKQSSLRRDSETSMRAACATRKLALARTVELKRVCRQANKIEAAV